MLAVGCVCLGGLDFLNHRHDSATSGVFWVALGLIAALNGILVLRQISALRRNVVVILLVVVTFCAMVAVELFWTR